MTASKCQLCKSEFEPYLTRPAVGTKRWCPECNAATQALRAGRDRRGSRAETPPHVEANIGRYRAWVEAGGRLEDLWAADAAAGRRAA